MAETYKVEQVFEPGKPYEFPKESGQYLVPHSVLMSGPEAPNQPVTLNRRQGSPPPEVGDELEGDILPGRDGPKFKKAWAGGSFNGGQGGQQQMSPERTRSIERQSCVKAAGPILAALTANAEWRKTFAEDSRFIVDALHAAVNQ